MRWHVWLIPSLGFALFLSGCTAPIEVIDYHCGQVPHISAAPTADMYTLMDNDFNRRVESTTCNFADDIGFVRQDGGLEAVAGDERIPLTDGNYSWVIEQPRFGGLHPSINKHAAAPAALAGLAAAAAAAAVVGTLNAVAGAQ